MSWLAFITLAWFLFSAILYIVVTKQSTICWSSDEGFMLKVTHRRDEAQQEMRI